MKISVIGLGKLGSPLAAVFASKGFEVIGVDMNVAAVEALNAGRAPVDEPQLQELIDKNRQRLSATQDINDAISGSDVTFVVVPTPSDASGRFSNAAVLKAMEGIEIGRAHV